MTDTKDKDEYVTPRTVFMGLLFMFFVWISVMVVLPAITGKPGVVQNMQSDLENSDTPQPIE